MTPRTLPRRVAAGGALAAGILLIAAGPASAHVTVQPSEAAPGSYSTVAFKVPNEEDSASTVKVQVFLPTDHPLASVSVQPVPGWTAKIAKTKLAKPITTDDGKVTEAVSSITWTGGHIRAGEFQQFAVSLGPLPKSGALTFKALQTYSNHDVVRWIEPARKGAPEPEHPAPQLQVVKAAAPGGTSAESAKPAAAAKSSSAGDATARTLGIVGIVAGVIGIAVGVLGFRRGSRRPAS